MLINIEFDECTIESIRKIIYWLIPTENEPILSEILIATDLFLKMYPKKTKDMAKDGKIMAHIIQALSSNESLVCHNACLIMIHFTGDESDDEIMCLAIKQGYFVQA